MKIMRRNEKKMLSRMVNFILEARWLKNEKDTKLTSVHIWRDKINLDYLLPFFVEPPKDRKDQYINLNILPPLFLTGMWGDHSIE
mmetsp:Transcript_25536/g.37746  ORF Transcript_25536/g.37746 Transcript_25536/m.37746 type:complete len:85 (+) Transcript_25536:182-436(+)